MEYVIGGLVVIFAIIGLFHWAAKSYVESILNDPTGGLVPIPVKNKNQPKVMHVKKNTMRFYLSLELETREPKA